MNGWLKIRTMLLQFTVREEKVIMFVFFSKEIKKIGLGIQLSGLACIQYVETWDSREKERN